MAISNQYSKLCLCFYQKDWKSALILKPVPLFRNITNYIFTDFATLIPIYLGNLIKKNRNGMVHIFSISFIKT